MEPIERPIDLLLLILMDNLSDMDSISHNLLTTMVMLMLISEMKILS
jgi:hypothetical protein